MAPSARARKLSVLIPTYKYAGFLREAIESILNQTFTNFELIISDDDSEDGSAEIIHEYASHDDRIRFKIQSPNLGMVHNWNWCLEQAQGRYIKYVFGDDFLISRDALRQLIDLIEAEPGIRLAACARMIVDDESTPIEIWSHIEREGVTQGAEMISLCLRQYRNLIGEPTVVLFRKEDAARGFDPSFRQAVDLEFWMHLLRGGALAYTRTPLCAFRRHDAQQTEVNRRAIDGAGEHVRLLRLYAEYFVLRPEYSYDVFRHLHRLRKKHQLRPHEVELAQLLSVALGDKYRSHWIRYKASRPFLDLRRFWRKYVLRTHNTRETAVTRESDTESNGPEELQ